MAIDTITSEAIEVINPTGRRVLQLTTNARRSVHGYYDLPPWSPVDGRIAFSRMDAPDSKTGDICVMDADGDNLYKVAESRAMSANGGRWRNGRRMDRGSTLRIGTAKPV